MVLLITGTGPRAHDPPAHGPQSSENGKVARGDTEGRSRGYFLGFLGVAAPGC